MSDGLERCSICWGEIGRAGAGEDSIYFGGAGPFCEECSEDVRRDVLEDAGVVAERDKLKAELEQMTAERDALLDKVSQLRQKFDAVVISESETQTKLVKAFDEPYALMAEVEELKAEIARLKAIVDSLPAENKESQIMSNAESEYRDRDEQLSREREEAKAWAARMQQRDEDNRKDDIVLMALRRAYGRSTVRSA